MQALQRARGAQRGSATLTPKERKTLNAGYTPEELAIINEIAPAIAAALGTAARTVATNAVKSAAVNAASSAAQKGKDRIKSLLGGNQQQEA